MSYNSSSESTVASSSEINTAPIITGVADLTGSPITENSTIAKELIKLSGTAEPGAPILIYIGGMQYSGGSANAQGQWSSVVPVGTGSMAIRVSSKGNMSEAFNLTVAPEAAPILPQITTAYADDTGKLSFIGNHGTTEDSTPLLQGRAPANSVVNILVHGRVVGTTVANEGGDWSYSPQLGEGLNVLTVSVNGQTSHPYLVNVQQAPVVDPQPELPNGVAITGITDASGSPVENGGNAASNSVTLFGTGNPGELLRVVINGKSAHIVHVGTDGRWSTDMHLSEGMSSIQVHSQSGGGISEPYALNVETAPIVTPEPQPDPEEPAVTIGANDDDTGVTESRSSNLHGKAPAFSSVTVSVNDQVIGVVTANDKGEWSLITALGNGENVLKATVGDVVSETFTLTVMGSPAPTINIVSDDHLQHSFVHNGGFTDDRSPKVTGIAQPGETVQIYINGAYHGSAQADVNGVWQYTLILDMSRNEFYVVEQGNTSQTFVINIEDAPQVLGIYDESGRLIEAGSDTSALTLEVRGKAQPHAEVKLYVGSAKPIILQADEHGDWRQIISADNGKVVVDVYSNGQYSEKYEFNYDPPQSTASPFMLDASVDSNDVVGDGSFRQETTSAIDQQASAMADISDDTDIAIPLSALLADDTAPIFATLETQTVALDELQLELSEIDMTFTRLDEGTLADSHVAPSVYDTLLEEQSVAGI